MRMAAWWVWSKVCAVARRLWLAATDANAPWDRDQFVDLHHPAMQRAIARARLDRRREAGAGVRWTYSRDRVVERRELRIESEIEKAARVAKARRDRLNATMDHMRLVI